MLSGVTQHWYHWKHVDVKHLFNFKWKLKVHTFVMQSQNQSMHVWLLNMWLLRIIKLDLFSCAIPELQCLCHNSTAWILEWEKKFSLCLEEGKIPVCFIPELFDMSYSLLTYNIALIFRITKGRKHRWYFQLVFYQKQEMPAVGISLDSPLRMAATEWWGIQAQAL